MKKTKNKKRRVVEIYFVLYLSLLVLLIPGKDETIEHEPDKINATSLLPFELKPEKTNLNCTFSLDTGGVRIISIDSVNRIFYTGNPESVEFEFVIEDKSYAQTVSIIPGQNKSEFFRVETDTNEQYAKFIWSPPITDRLNKSYLVTVVANFTKEDASIRKKTQFSLNKNFLNTREFQLVRDTAQGTAGELQSEINTNIFQNAGNIGELNLIPMEYNIKTVAYQNWQNTINVTGLDLKSDLLKNPELNVTREPEENGGTAYISEIENNKLIIDGKAPAYGSMQVSISITRQIDGAEGTVSFSVLPQPVGMPEFPRKMFPGIEYTFEPNLPILSGQSTSAALKTKDGKVLAESESGYKFNYIPGDDETGQEIIFERYIDGKKFGQSYSIEIKEFPAPEFSRIQKIDENTLRIFTHSFGLYEGEENYVPELQIEGNAVSTEIIGQARFDGENLVYTQVFEISPEDPSQKFEFTAVAVNVKGKKSEKLKYPKNN